MIKEFIEIIITYPQREKAEETARYLVQTRLAACCQISGPINSIYTWNKKVNEDQEFALTVKTRKDLYEEIEEQVLRTHPYETPQIISFNIIEGLEPYMKWLKDSTKN